MQQEDFRKLNGVISTHGKHLESRVNALLILFFSNYDIPFTI